MTKTNKAGKAKANQELKNLLEIINFVPPDVDLPNAKEILLKAFEEKTSRQMTDEDMENFKSDSDFTNSVQKTVRILRGELSEYRELNSYIFENHYDELIDEFEILDRYKDFIYYRQKIRFVAQEASYFQKTGRRKISVSSVYQPELFTTSFEIGKDGKITFQTDKVIRALEGIDIKRLRICEVCNRIFWANRLEKIGCSDKCNQTLRTRRKRTKDKNRFKSRVQKETS